MRIFFIIKREAKFPLDLEPIDPEKKLLRERVNTLEVLKSFFFQVFFFVSLIFQNLQAQLQLMTERYKSLHSNITKIRTETYKLRQKMKVIFFFKICVFTTHIPHLLFYSTK